MRMQNHDQNRQTAFKHPFAMDKPHCHRAVMKREAIVCTSEGPDSMWMLHCLQGLAPLSLYKHTAHCSKINMCPLEIRIQDQPILVNSGFSFTKPKRRLFFISWVSQLCTFQINTLKCFHAFPSKQELWENKHDFLSCKVQTFDTLWPIGNWKLH